MKTAALCFLLIVSCPVFAQQAPAPPASASSTPPVDAAAVDDLDIPEASSQEETVAREDQAQEAAARDPAAMNPAPADPSLIGVYRAFGEQPGLVALMDLFMTKLLADPRTGPFFANADQAGVKRHLVEQFCVILGGPCTYTGRDMKTSHKGMGIGEADWDATIEDLTKSLRKFKVPRKEQKELLALLGPMKADIVEKH